jgi:hypothetical protein
LPEPLDLLFLLVVVPVLFLGRLADQVPFSKIGKPGSSGGLLIASIVGMGC